MTLLTTKILQQIKDKFEMRMTWDLGVVRVVIRVEDGGHELHRKVPYDYDSEYQDMYLRIAEALIDGEINVHEALIYQTEAKQGVHTAKSGLFLRDFPGRLVLYPLEAATCAVIFFSGDWADAYVAAICGLVSGLIEYIIGLIGGDIKILVDICVGISTGIIGGLFYKLSGGQYCISSIFLGTLYWFFYGTAFVVGILEIIAGELQTGVTRFIAVSVKTFVLSLGAALGLMIATTRSARTVWVESSEQQCGLIDLGEVWWRVPLYILCSAAVLGQYRAPIVQYWRALIVMLCAYEVQYRAFIYLEPNHNHDNLDTSASNIAGAASAVISACILSAIVNYVRSAYKQKLLVEDNKTKIGSFVAKCMEYGTQFGSCIGIGRASDMEKLRLKAILKKQKKELRDSNHARSHYELNRADENLIIETIVGNQDLNVWSILMPALYQLVPGSIIAKLWFNSIFPPLPEDDKYIPGTDTVFSNLMVISTSLALGLIVGFVTVQAIGSIFLKTGCLGDVTDKHRRALGRVAGMYSVPITRESYMKVPAEESEANKENGGGEVKEPVQTNNEYFPVSLETATQDVEGGQNETTTVLA